MTAVPITSDILDAVSGERMAATVAALAGDGFAGRRVGAAGAPRPAPGSVSTWPRSAPPSPSSRSPALIASTGAAGIWTIQSAIFPEKVAILTSVDWSHA
jgi:hypothetical protein